MEPQQQSYFTPNPALEVAKQKQHDIKAAADQAKMLQMQQQQQADEQVQRQQMAMAEYNQQMQMQGGLNTQQPSGLGAIQGLV